MRSVVISHCYHIITFLWVKCCKSTNQEGGSARDKLLGLGTDIWNTYGSKDYATFVVTLQCGTAVTNKKFNFLRNRSSSINLSLLNKLLLFQMMIN